MKKDFFLGTIVTPRMAPKKVVKSIVLKRIKAASGKNPVTARDLGALTTGRLLRDTAHIRRLIRELIKEGNPIASNTDGYFYIRSPKQCQIYLNRLLKQQTRISDRISDTYHAYFKS